MFVALRRHQTAIIAAMSLLLIAISLVLRFVFQQSVLVSDFPLQLLLIIGGFPLLVELAAKLFRGEFGSDLLGGLSIITAVLLGEYLAGAIIVLMLSGGEALEHYALRSASSVLAALAKRMPNIAHRQQETLLEEIPLEEIRIGDTLVVFPHEICPADGIVLSGHGSMDESYLTGEPFQITKTAGANVISGAINGEAALTITVTQRAADSRYAKIMQVMQMSESQRPRLRRLGDQLGAWYTPLALSIAGLAWFLSGEAIRFLAVLVIATPCPLLIAIPVSVIGSISLCARRAIIVKSPVVLEQISQCRTAIFDKTGTLTYGEPVLTEILLAPGQQRREILQQVASLEQYSKHPLAMAIFRAAEQDRIALLQCEKVSEPPGQGLTGVVAGQQIRITSRKQLAREQHSDLATLPPSTAGLECVVMQNSRYAATFRFRDAPRADSQLFVRHLGPRHGFERLMIVSGDRASEVRYLAEQVGISEIYAEQQPEQKLQIVQAETARAKTLYVGDGINDAPAMLAATVGMAIGQNSDVTAEAAGVVIMDNSLEKVDEFLHISRRMRRIALQSAVGGMLLSLVGMLLAAAGYLPPVQGAIAQELIDVLAVLNALRAAWRPRLLSDMK